VSDVGRGACIHDAVRGRAIGRSRPYCHVMSVWGVVWAILLGPSWRRHRCLCAGAVIEGSHCYCDSGGGAGRGGPSLGGTVPGPGGEPFLRWRIATTIQTSRATAAAPISAHAHPGRPLDSLDLDALLWLAAAAPRAAAGALFLEVVVVGAVIVWVLMTVFVCVGVVTVVVFAGAVVVCVCVTVLVGAVTVVVEE
jgi:hypothetical protein